MQALLAGVFHHNLNVNMQIKSSFAPLNYTSRFARPGLGPASNDYKVKQ